MPNPTARPRFFIRTYGCQMNVRDSEKLSGTLRALGYDEARDEADADLTLYNTCCVRANAEHKIFGHLGYLKHQKAAGRKLTVVLCGCMAQQAHIAREIAEGHPYIDLVFGTFNRHRFPDLLRLHRETGRQVIDIARDAPPACESDADADGLTARRHPHKAGVNVMYGCDNFCAYCVVPHVRGRERSRGADDVLREVTALARDGVKEVMLLGQNVNTYGKGLGTDFAGLLRRVNGVAGLERVRFMTSHPKDLSDGLIAAVRDCEKVCKAVHLPLQSGSSRVLADMNRRYTKEGYLDAARRLRAAVPGVALSTDIMVGYPGETEEDFSQTLDAVRQADFAGAFTFIYSPRVGTPAARRPDAVPEAVAAARFARLTALLNPLLLARHQRLVGQTLAVMIDDGGPGRHGTRKGRADDNTLAHVRGGAYKPGDVVRILVTEAKTFYVTGEETHERIL